MTKYDYFLISKTSHLLDLIAISVCLAAIYGLTGMIIKLLSGREIRSEKGFILVACVGGAFLKLLLPMAL